MTSNILQDLFPKSDYKKNGYVRIVLKTIYFCIWTIFVDSINVFGSYKIDLRYF
jgi:hypothetical protein